MWLCQEHHVSSTSYIVAVVALECVLFAAIFLFEDKTWVSFFANETKLCRISNKAIIQCVINIMYNCILNRIMFCLLEAMMGV